MWPAWCFMTTAHLAFPLLAASSRLALQVILIGALLTLTITISPSPASWPRRAPFSALRTKAFWVMRFRRQIPSPCQFRFLLFPGFAGVHHLKFPWCLWFGLIIPAHALLEFRGNLCS